MPEPTDIVDSLAELDINPDIRHATYDPASGTINIVPPKPTIQQVLNCSFGSWYPKFRRVTPKARILSPLPDDFIKYLHADGIQLPNDSRLGHAGDDNSDQDSDVDDDGANDLFTFTQLDTEINDMIADLGGSVFPKLNWSSPKDAAWMAGNSLKCHTSSDVYLLLKSSDFVTHDLAHAFDECAEIPISPISTSSDLVPGSEKDSTFRLELVLKKWFDYAPSMEFRCFVRDQSLIAITQRDMTHYAFLLGMRSRLISIMLAFFEENIKGRFPDKDYVMDLYLTRDVTKCWLVDFSPWSTTTDTCLWSWNELLQISSNLPPPLRLLHADGQVSEQDLPHARPEAAIIGAASMQPNFTHNRLPREVIELSQGASIAEFAERWERELRRATEDTSDEPIR